MDQEVTQSISPESQASSESFLAQWRTLVSTTNWQKGQIICQWRNELRDQGASVSDYSDEAWSQLAGDVSAQHVGRLRRVYERFADTWRSYEGLYWTHFFAAYDWGDAEMWLEGALQNDWSVAKMRQQRSETLGSIPEPLPLDDRFVADESFASEDDGNDSVPTDIVIEHLQSFVSDEDRERRSKRTSSAKQRVPRSLDEVGSLWRSPPLAALPSQPAVEELPGDFALALEQFSAVLRRHQSAGWVDLPKEVVLATLQSLELLIADDGLEEAL